MIEETAISLNDLLASNRHESDPEPPDMGDGWPILIFWGDAPPRTLARDELPESYVSRCPYGGWAWHHKDIQGPAESLTEALVILEGLHEHPERREAYKILKYAPLLRAMGIEGYIIKPARP